MTEVLKLLRLTPDGREGADYRPRVLDLGCGPCEEGDALLAAGARLTCVDQDGETNALVRERIPEAEVVTADAAQWLAAGRGPYDAVLVRRPDLFHRVRNWQQVFDLIPAVLAPGGRVVVTTPGRGEARLVERWLSGYSGTVTEIETGTAEEGYAIVAENVRKVEAPDGSLRDNERASLVQSLMWEDDEPAMVCDVRTGKCTMVSSDGRPDDGQSDSE